MVVYIAKKPCRFGGQNYLIGDKIPADKILPRRVGSLVRMGVIMESEEKEAVPASAPPPVQEPKEEAPAETGKKAKTQK